MTPIYIIQPPRRSPNAVDHIPLTLAIDIDDTGAATLVVTATANEALGLQAMLLGRRQPLADLAVAREVGTVDSGAAALRFAVQLPPKSGTRVGVWLSPDAEPRTFDQVEWLLQHGTVACLPSNEAICNDELSLTHRYQGSGTPRPIATMDTCCRVAAELVEDRQPRSAILGRADFDEGGWCVEERAWLEKLAAAARAGDVSLAEQYSSLFIAAQDGLADETDADRADYARVRAYLEVWPEPGAVLAFFNITVPAWFRLERAVTRRAAGSATFATQLRRDVSHHAEQARVDWLIESRGHRGAA